MREGTGEGHRPARRRLGQHPGQVVLRAGGRGGDAGAGRAQALPRGVRVPRAARQVHGQSSQGRDRGGSGLSHVTITINGRTLEVPKGTLLTDAARMLTFYSVGYSFEIINSCLTCYLLVSYIFNDI